MKAAFLCIFVPGLAICADAPKATSAYDEKPEYVKQLEEWTPAKSTPPPPVAHPETFFGLQGKVLITDAATYLDGGSIKVVFRDEEGLTLHVVRWGYFTAEQQKNYLVNVSFPGRLAGEYMLREGGMEERALLALTRQAIEATFGSEKPVTGPDRFRFQTAERLRKILSHNLHEPEP